jgi:hypothetical protein
MLLPPPDITQSYVEPKGGNPTKEFFNWIKQFYTYTTGLPTSVPANPFQTVQPSGDTSGATDTANINNALSGGRSTVFLTGKDYYANALIDIPTNSNVVGMGQLGGTIVHPVGNPATLFRFNGSANGSLRELGIQGACNTAVLITGSGSNQNLIDRVGIYSGAGTINYGVSLTGGTSAYFNRVHRSVFVSVGVAVNLDGDGSALETELAFLDIGGGTTGVYAHNSLGYFSATRVDILGPSANGFDITDTSAFDLNGCMGDSCGGNGFNLNNILHGGRLTGCWAGTNGIGYQGNNSQLEFSGCEAGNNSLEGFLIKGTAGLASKTCIAVNGSAAWGNNTVGGGHNGFYFQDCLCTVTGNFSGARGGTGGTQAWGFFFDTGAIGLAVGNSGTGNTNTPTVHVGGTLTTAGNF